MVVFITALALQVSKSRVLEGFFVVDQVFNEDKAHYLNTTVPKQYKKILVLYGTKDEGSIALYNNIEHTLNMAKINFEEIHIHSDQVKNKINDLRKEDLLVIATEKINEMINPQSLITYVKNGGTVIFLNRFMDSKFDQMIGIIENKGYYKEELYGFHFEKPLFPGLDDIEINNKKVVHSSLDVVLSDKVEILATAQNMPILWTNKFGQGKILYTNSTLFMDKVNRGLMLQYISYLDDYFISTIFNGKIVNIDDFPAPIKRGKDKIIYDDYNMNNKKFFRHIWWSALHNIAVKYNIKYTGLIIGTYNDRTINPLPELNSLALEDIQYFGRKLVEINGEMGIHGYNHNSLALEGQMNFDDYGYHPWESEDTMEKGLKILKENLENIYGDIKIHTYVPPSNMISREGKLAVKNVFKDLKVFAGLYTGTKEEGVLYQEFGKDADFNDVYKFPRLSSGYHYKKDLMWDIYNGIAHYGIINHFIHPDDVLDPNRSKGDTWNDLEGKLSRIFRETYNNYSFLRPMTDIEAYKEYVNKENLKVYTTKKDNLIEIYYENLVPPAYHFLRLKQDKILKVQGGDFSIIDKDTGLYLITGTASKIKILLK